MNFKKKEIQTQENLVMLSDSYKYSHTEQYESNVVGMYDYAEARSGKVYDKTVFVGLQYIMKKYLSKKITMKMVKEARKYANAHSIPFNYKGWKYIAKKLEGKLPIRIKAIPEGCVVPVKNPLFTVESTDPKVYWVASWAETILLKVWYPCNVATKSYFVKKILTEYASNYSTSTFVGYQFLNFSDRGCSSVESAGVAGVAHLTQFMGTDNFNSLTYAMKYYNVEDINTIGHSVRASEHSSTTSWGRDFEFDMILNHYKKGKGDMVVASVLDSYNYFKAVRRVCDQNGEFQKLINSDEYPIFVMRPDSGEPSEIIEETLRIMLEEKVPFTYNDKGYIVFNKMKILFGDGIDTQKIIEMLDVAVSMKVSPENLVFGMGGGLVNDTRDSQGWAIKCSSITLSDGTERDVFKDPITAPKKKSKRGRITTFIRPDGTYFADVIGSNDSPGENAVEALKVVFENGEMVKEYTLDEVRENSKRVV